MVWTLRPPAAGACEPTYFNTVSRALHVQYSGGSNKQWGPPATHSHMRQRLIVGGAVAAVVLLLSTHARQPSAAISVVRQQVRPDAAMPPPAPLVPPPSARPLTLDTADGLDAAASLAVRRELILTTSDTNGLASAFNLAWQLERLELEGRLLLLADKLETCVEASKSSLLPCGWSVGIPGFERYESTGVVKLWTLWSAKWLVLARLVERRINVLMLDTDMMMLADPYPLLLTPPLRRFALILPPEGARVNVGFLYARGAAAVGGLSSMLWDMVRRLRLFVEAMTLRDREGRPSVQGLWDQGLFTDALLSAIVGTHVYPFTWSHSPAAFDEHRGLQWPPRGFTAANGSAMLRSLWRRTHDWTARRPLGFLPTLPARHPQLPNWRSAAPLMWNRLQSLDPLAGLDAALVASHPDLQPAALLRDGADHQEGAHITSSSPRASLSDDLVGAAPDWLQCTTGYWMMTAGWLSADRPVCAVLHLVESRSQFVHYSALDTLKANRVYVMRAYGYWRDELADAAPLTSAGVPAGAHADEPAATPPPRLIRLGEDILQLTASSGGIGVLLNALQLLAALAALTGRTPVVPRVPCTSRWLATGVMTPHGIADDYVMQLPPDRPPASLTNGSGGQRPVRVMSGGGPRPSGVSCHLSIGGAHCAAPIVHPAWQRVGRTTALPFALPATRLRVDSGDSSPGLPPPEASHALATASELRERANRYSDASVLEIGAEGLAGARAEALPGAPHRTAHDANASVAKRFQCGVPVEIIHTSELSARERARLRVLRSSCPAFFAERGTSKRRHLDRLHRRRKIVDPSCIAHASTA